MRPFFTFVFILYAAILFSQDSIGITLQPQSPGYRIPDDFAGLSFEKSSLNKVLFAPSKDTLLQLFKTLQIQSVRIGGNSVDKDTFGIFTNGTHFTKANLDSFYLFIGAAECRVLAGLNFGGWFNPTLASKEVSYIMSKYAPLVRGFEVGNEPDLYYENGLRPSTFNVVQYDSEYTLYYDTILFYTSNAVLTGPVAAYNYTGFTLPFCREMHGRFNMLTQHYYVAGANSLNNHNQIISLLNPTHQASLDAAANELVLCADSAGVPFRIAECNSLYNGGQWGVSDAFVSSLWSLDYMYGLAAKGCAGVNFHGALGGAYSPLAYANGLYSARPISYGILAFNAGSRGQLIPAIVTNNNINLSVYSVLDSLNNTYTTIINKDTLANAFITLNGGDNLYTTASYITLSDTSLADTSNVTLGGQQVAADGTLQPYTWQSLPVSFNITQLSVPAASAVIVKFSQQAATGVEVQTSTTKGFKLFPNPANNEIFLTASENPETGTQIEIFDVPGKRLYSQAIYSTKTTIDIHTLSTGIYFVKVLRGDTEIYTSRFVKD